MYGLECGKKYALQTKKYDYKKMASDQICIFGGYLLSKGFYHSEIAEIYDYSRKKHLDKKNGVTGNYLDFEEFYDGVKRFFKNGEYPRIKDLVPLKRLELAYEKASSIQGITKGISNQAMSFAGLCMEYEIDFKMDKLIALVEILKNFGMKKNKLTGKHQALEIIYLSVKKALIRGDNDFSDLMKGYGIT
jgi:hypothetical protein